MNEPMVWLKDVKTLEWIRFGVDEWIDIHQRKIDHAMALYRSTLGGMLIIKGTPESGTICVLDANSDADPLLHIEWTLVQTADNPAIP